MFHFNNKGFVNNNVSAISILAFVTVLFSIGATNIIYDRVTNKSSNKSTKNSVTLSREQYRKELESFPVEIGMGTASFSLSTLEQKYIFNQVATINLKMTNSAVSSSVYPYGFVMALFVPDTMDIIDPPQNANFDNVLLNYVEYLKVTGGTQINIGVLAKINAPISQNTESTVIQLKVKLKTEGVNTISFVKKLPNYPEIVDTSEKSMLDVSTLKDLIMVVDKPVAQSPVISPDSSGDFYRPANITINSSSPDTKVKYTKDGTDPKTSSTAITLDTFPANITVDGNSSGVIKAYSFGLDYNDSVVVTKTYTFKVAPLDFSILNPSSLVDVTTEMVTSKTPGIKVYYSTNSQVPITPENLLPSTGLTINKFQSLYFVGVKDNYTSTNYVNRNYYFPRPTVTLLNGGSCDNSSSALKCNIDINDKNSENLILNLKVELASFTTKNITLTWSTNSTQITEFIGVPDSTATNVFKVTIPNYKNYIVSGYPILGGLNVKYTNTVETGNLITLSFRYAPEITNVTPYTTVNTYDAFSFKVSSLANNSTLSKIYLYRKDPVTLATTQVFVGNATTSSITDFVLTDPIPLVGKKSIYFITVEDSNGLKTNSNEVTVNYFQKGDVNKDFKLDLTSDLIPMINAIFESSLVNLESMDIDGNKKLDVVDLIKFLKNYFS